MGILDFREICSANALHKSVKHASLGHSNVADDFELFCLEFFEHVKKFEIFRFVSNGPDLGIDLGVIENTKDGPIRWLVSCKHYAHSNQYISDKVEYNIVEKVGSWDCDGFIPFYTSVPSTSLSQALSGAEKYTKVKRFYKQKIESELLSTSSGVEIAARYFPKSMVNHYRNFIKPSNEYSVEDIQVIDDVATLLNMSIHLNIIEEGDDQSLIEELTRRNTCALKRMVKDANIMSGFNKHESYFKKALNDAISEFPNMFTLKFEGEKNHPYDYLPTWDFQRLVEVAEENGLSKAYFIGAVWSFWDYRQANFCFADFMICWASSDLRDKHNFDAYKNSNAYDSHRAGVMNRGLLTPGLLAIKLQDNERDIVARLMAYGNVIPTTQT